jgi:two-component system sensor histidine kinase RegB
MMLEGFGPSDRARVTLADGEDIRVVWPAGVIAQTLTNLAKNALQASPASAPVTIGASTLGDGRVQIVVMDTGAGMTPEDLARAGEPFFTTKPAGAGMGLGLFVTRAAVEQLGGELVLTSSRGNGTAAAIRLPPNVVRHPGDVA